MYKRNRVVRLENVRDLIQNVQTGKLAGWDYTNYPDEPTVYIGGHYSSHKTLFIVEYEFDCYADAMEWMADAYILENGEWVSVNNGR